MQTGTARARSATVLSAYDDILGSFDGYFAQAKLAEAEKETIPKLKQQVSDLQSVNEGLSAQITQAQLALCDVYELVIGG